ncbi:family 15 glycoside hydrolase [Pseudohyphozyma bogoriensis]|nr:family 15 glycoside hydrolase [Pseudohyphozyma bogoriensis]
MPPVPKKQKQPPPQPAIGFLATFGLVGSLLSALYLASWATSSVERFERVKSYPSRFTIQGLPADIYSLVPNHISSVVESFLGFAGPLDFEEWVDWEEKKAWGGLLMNVHPDGTMPGCVVASPSTFKPDYWYQWTRDSALVMRSVVNAYISGESQHRHLIDEYIAASECTPFTGEWSRPQPDGPGARVITLVKFASYLLDFGNEDDKAFVKTKLYDSKSPTKSIIKGDMEYLARHWGDPGYDLWEEVQGTHFYTLLATRTALFTGASLATKLGDDAAATYYRTQALIIEGLLPKFWSEEKGVVRVTVNHTIGRDSEENAHKGDDTYGKTSELDAAVILAVLHSGDGTDWSVGNDKILSTLDGLMKAMSKVYPLNKGRLYPALGRYPEDVYDGVGISHANPWHLCTLAAAELLYKHSALLSNSSAPLVVSKISKKWYERFLPLPEGGATISPGTGEYGKIVDGQKAVADGLVGIVKEFAGRNGSLHEQFDRITGEGRGARDLTWSYASFTTAAEARRGCPLAKKPRPNHSASVW